VVHPHLEMMEENGLHAWAELKYTSKLLIPLSEHPYLHLAFHLYQKIVVDSLGTSGRESRPL
jgi:hypothetical protein